MCRLLDHPIGRSTGRRQHHSRGRKGEADGGPLLEHRQRRHQRHERGRHARREVPNPKVKAEAEARSVSGVVKVINNLQVKNPSPA
jgi:hypothetical protein